RVVCLACGAVEVREAVQARMAAANGAVPTPDAEIRPDGDALVDDRGFVVPACLACGGPLKPAVVLFGDNVPRAVVDAAYARLADAEGVLVVGSSLTVFSGYRFVKRAAERGLPVGIVNRGPTRADPLATARLDATAGEVLPLLAEALASALPDPPRGA
ncbi:MAG: Sir2 family NAD-dependent protein deacetylase, partial [Myxococcota bacterium]